MPCAWPVFASSGAALQTATIALAQPVTPSDATAAGGDMPRPLVAITTAPAPSPGAPPRAYPPPPANTPPVPASEDVAAPPAPRADRLFFAMGALVGGGGPSDWLYGAYHVEAAATVLRAGLRTPVRARARVFGVLVGGTLESDWTGDFSRVGGGIEVRACTQRLGACAFADLDVGYQALALDDGDGRLVRSDKGVFVGPRLGFDAGAALRVRLAIEAYRMFATHVDASGSRDHSFGTVALSLGVGYQL